MTMRLNISMMRSRRHQRLQQLRHHDGGQLAAQTPPQHLLIAIQHQLTDFLRPPGKRVGHPQAASAPSRTCPAGMRTRKFPGLVG